MKTLLQKRLEKPLESGEVRRMEGMGELYATLPGTTPTEGGYRFRYAYTLSVGGVEYHFYHRYQAAPDE